MLEFTRRVSAKNGSACKKRKTAVENVRKTTISRPRQESPQRSLRIRIPQSFCDRWPDEVIQIRSPRAIMSARSLQCLQLLIIDLVRRSFWQRLKREEHIGNHI